VPRAFLTLALQVGDDGVFLPEGGGSTLVWLVFAGVITALYVIVSRSRRRADDVYWERRRALENPEHLPEPEDPTQLP
jgi:hypothetical protein